MYTSKISTSTCSGLSKFTKWAWFVLFLGFVFLIEGKVGLRFSIKQEKSRAFIEFCLIICCKLVKIKSISIPLCYHFPLIFSRPFQSLVPILCIIKFKIVLGGTEVLTAREKKPTHYRCNVHLLNEMTALSHFTLLHPRPLTPLTSEPLLLNYCHFILASVETSLLSSRSILLCSLCN